MLFFVSAVGRCDNASRLFAINPCRLRVFFRAYSARASEMALFRTKKVWMITCTTHTLKVRQIAQKWAKIEFILDVAGRTCKGEGV